MEMQSLGSSPRGMMTTSAIRPLGHCPMPEEEEHAGGSHAQRSYR